MHIQEGTNSTLTTCTKMTEEVDRRHGVNGNSSSKAVSEEASVNNSSLNATGGRLKFFKDGKFILELVRGVSREGGGGGGWVSVPRKTFWPPAAAPATPPTPHPPSALSVSDDNSSVQSSPWQRDHCWKQAAPRKNLSKELALYYCRPGALATPAIEAASRLKRRRPFDPTPHDAPRRPPSADGDAPAEDAVDGADCDREMYHRIKLKKPYQYRKLRVYRKTRPRLRRKLLARVVARLAERAPALAPVNAKLAHCRQEHAIVSPRKRILRELERVSLEEGTKRRAKTAPALSTASYPPAPSPGPSRAPPAPAPAPPAPPPAAKHVSSYSIHSLLSMPDEAAEGRRASPQQHALQSECSSSVTSPSPELSPSPDGYRYRYAGARGGYGGAWGGGYRREEWGPYVYGYGYLPAQLYRAPPPLWMQYGVAPAPSPWPPLLTDHMPKDDTASDLPLNLSKH